MKYLSKLEILIINIRNLRVLKPKPINLSPCKADIFTKCVIVY